MSKQSKKQKKRRDRQRKKRRRNLIVMFNSLYPRAPEGMAQQVIEAYLATRRGYESGEQSNTAMVQAATLDYVRQHLTPYRHQIDNYIEAVLDSLEAGKAYTAQTPQTLEAEPNLEAEKIIATWRSV